jgi:hypothetical protein
MLLRRLRERRHECTHVGEIGMSTASDKEILVWSLENKAVVASLRPRPMVSANGNVAIIQDDGSIFGRANFFNLDRSTLRFTPQATGGCKVEEIPRVWDGNFGGGISWDGQSDPGSKQINFAALSFPFGGS